jgi:hypothetical protein
MIRRNPYFSPLVRFAHPSTFITAFKAIAPGQNRRASATESASALLPTDRGRAAVSEAWDRLPEAVGSSIMMLVKAASGGG